MQLAQLLLVTEPTDEGDRQVVDGVMLTMLRPDGYDNMQHPIESVAIVEDCVVITLQEIEDATWYDAESFDEDITIWKSLP